MKKLIFAGLMLVSSLSQAALINVTSTSYQAGTANNDLSIVTDGVFPAEGTNWNTADKVWWTGTTTAILFDLGALYNVEDFKISVDNNDTYALAFSETLADLGSVLPLEIASSLGQISFGMETFTSISGDSGYESDIDFAAPITAQYVLLSAVSGDGSYSVGELALYGELSVTDNDDAAEVHAPSAALMLLMGLAFVFRQSRKAKA